MSKKPKTQPLPQEDSEPAGVSDAGRREAVIRTSVLKALGQPAKLFRVAVLPLWENHYRVNVVTGEGFSDVTIPNSYFVTVDESGAIVGAVPPISKQY